MKHHLNKALNENGSATDKVISRVEKVAEQTKGGIAVVGGGGAVLSAKGAGCAGSSSATRSTKATIF